MAQRDLKQTILLLVDHMERPKPDSEERIPELLEQVLSTCRPSTAVLARQAIEYYQAAQTTDVFKNPRLWKYRFGKFVDMVEEVSKEELGNVQVAA